MSLSVSATTRPPRPSEVDGREYKFMQKGEFEGMADRGEFLEHALVFGNHYGTPRAPVEAMLIQGRDVLFDVDWQGARALRAAEPQDVVGIFILPPSMAELERRLRARAEDSEEVIQSRMARSLNEISHWEEYDYVLVNTLLGRRWRSEANPRGRAPEAQPPALAQAACGAAEAGDLTAAR